MFAVPAGSPGSQLVPGNHQAQSDQWFRVCSLIGSHSPPLPTSADSSTRGAGRGYGRDTPGTKGTTRKRTTKATIGAGYSGSRGRREPIGNRKNATPEKAEIGQGLRGSCQHLSAWKATFGSLYFPEGEMHRDASRCIALPLGRCRGAPFPQQYARARELDFP